MSFATQAAAKRFFVARVLEQATADGVRLSEAEQRMLAWSESDPEFTPDPALPPALEAEMSDEAYEAKIAALIRAAYARDVARDPGAKTRYREAYATLAAGDHYILIMIRRALGLRLRRWWPF